MSVPEGERNVGKMQVFLRARELVQYTTIICKNPHNFPPDISKTILDELIRTPILIFTKAWEANTVFIRSDGNREKDLETRYDLQREALRLSVDMTAYISLASKIYHMPIKRTRTWMMKTKEIRNLLKAWHDSAIRAGRRMHRKEIAFVC